jgi:hypothetical protein
MVFFSGCSPLYSRKPYDSREDFLEDEEPVIVEPGEKEYEEE